MKRIVWLLFLVAAVGLVPAMADWSAAYHDSGNPTPGIDEIIIQWVAGSQFAPQTFTALTPNWTNGPYDSATLAQATGAASMDEYFTFNFAGDGTNGAEFNYWGLLNGQVVTGDSGVLSIGNLQIAGQNVGNGWNWTAIDGLPVPSVPSVPEPSGVLLLAAMLLGVAGACKLKFV
jgi:hypothetical protein